MSKLDRILASKFTGQERPDPTTFGSVTSSFDETTTKMSFERQREYIFKFEWRNVFYCNQENLGRARKTVIEQFKHDVYGDLKEFILRLQQAIYEGDRKRAFEILDKMEADL